MFKQAEAAPISPVDLRYERMRVACEIGFHYCPTQMENFTVNKTKADILGGLSGELKESCEKIFCG